MTSHEPTPEFRSHLEWQIETAMRRESRLAEPVTGPAPSGWLRTAIVVLVALAIGGAAGIASERVQDAKTRNELIQSAISEEALMRTRVELARAEFEQARRMYEIGAVGRESLAESERRVRAMESALKRLQLDIEETKATSAPPRNDLSAPLVGQRDYVRDRLTLELQTAEQALAAAEQALARAKERISAGVVPQTAALAAEAELRLVLDRMQHTRMQIELREKYVGQQIKAEDLAASARQMELTIEQSAAQRDSTAARQKLEAVKKLFETGLVSLLEVKRAEVELLELELKLKKIQQQLAATGKKE